MKNSRIIFVDIDEVLADFTTPAVEIHRWTRNQLERERSPGQWSIEKTMGLSTNEFWEPINALGTRFWIDIKPLPWFEELLAVLEGLNDQTESEWFLLSSPSVSPSAHLGKCIWIRNYFGTQFDRFFITPYKELFAQADRILIDDSEENLFKFERHGGKGVLFPSRGNAMFHEAANPIPYVKEQLNALVLS